MGVPRFDALAAGTLIHNLFRLLSIEQIIHELISFIASASD
jgi:hypothetical protein